MVNLRPADQIEIIFVQPVKASAEYVYNLKVALILK